MLPFVNFITHCQLLQHEQEQQQRLFLFKGRPLMCYPSHHCDDAPTDLFGHGVNYILRMHGHYVHSGSRVMAMQRADMGSSLVNS